MYDVDGGVFLTTLRNSNLGYFHFGSARVLSLHFSVYVRTLLKTAFNPLELAVTGTVNITFCCIYSRVNLFV